ncbi:unnamed protein product [Mytilus coruscus]|uniref:CCHC-type domain-containing protein n=1 Tax=Mytilus coruscus TaxID=42192 RepID=A0A6J8AS30_MYTCO|nr:unnamed protein product [Mytilus coruscus]
MNDDELDREEKIMKSDSPTTDIASWMQTMEKSLSTLTTEMAKLKTIGTSYNKTRYTQSKRTNKNCYNCGKFGHLARDCRIPRRNQNNYNGNKGDGSVKTLPEAVVIPPRSEIVINGTVCLAEGQKLPADNALLEANDHAGKDYILTARTLVRSGEKVPVRLMNTELDPKTIYPGTTVAQMSEVDRVLDRNICSNEQKRNGLRPDLQDLLDRTSDELTLKDKQKVKSLLIENQNLFASSDVDLGRTNLVKHEISMGNARPFKEPPRRTPYHLNKVLNDNIDTMLQKEIIEPFHSPWAAGIVLVKKKDDSYRFCIDYRRLNSVTLNKDVYPLPRIDDSLDHLAGNKWYSTLDCCSGYWQVELAENDKHKTAFATRRGLFQFRVMPFGLCCAAQTFERLMETILAGLQKFTVRTDHGSLKWLLNFKNPEGQIARWIETLGSFEMQIQHRSGTQHRNADALSRIPCKQCGYHSGLETETVSAETGNQHDTVNAITRFGDSNDKDDDNEHHDLSLKEIQKNDHDLKIVTEWVEIDERPDYKDISDKGFFIRSLWNQ